MICTLVEFPADLHELERAHVETVRSEVIAAVALVRRAPARTGNLSNDEANFVAAAIRDRLGGSIVEWGRRLSPAVRSELVDDGVSVRLRWDQSEANRRSERGRRLEAEQRAREQRAAERANRERMRAALADVRANVPATTIRDVLNHDAAKALEAIAAQQETELLGGMASASYGLASGSALESIPLPQSNPVGVAARSLLGEVHVADAGRVTVYLAAEGANIRPGDMVALDANGRAVRATSSTGSPFARVSFTGDAGASTREFRREVLGEFVDPGPSRYPLHARRPNPYPFATMIAQQTTSSVEHVRSGYVIRSREGEAPVQARGGNEAELEELVRGRRDGDRFYFVRAPDFAPSAIAPMKHWPDPLAEIPGTLAYGIAKAAERRREAAIASVDLLLRVVLAVALAHERIRAGAEAFYSFAYGALRAWSKNPAGLELDVEIAPFGIDLSPPADDFAARVALLELAELPPRRE